jgi:hypothetical protein
MSLGDVLWSLLVIYIMIFYFMALFRILGDLFRDSETGALAKTAWIIALLLLPFLSLFAYLLVRGNGMGEREIAQAYAAQSAQKDYIRRVAGTADDPGAKIAKAQDLLNAGAITQPEFESLKAKALA